jgi:hypothetical protein
MTGGRRWLVAVVLGALVAVLGGVPIARAGVRDAIGNAGLPRPVCGPGDRPEPGLSGQVPIKDQLSGRSRDGYSCNLRWIGGTRLDGLGGDTQMTWYGPCAYRVVPANGAASDGVAVIDVRDPANPVMTTLLREPQWAGQGILLNVHEGVHASEASGLLVVPAGRIISVYDLRADCTQPVLRSTLDTGPGSNPASQLGLDTGFHSGQLSPDGTFFYGTTAGLESFVAPFGPCLTIVDLIDPAHPKVVARWGEDFPCHDLGFDLTGNRAFVGTYKSVVGHPSAVVGAFVPVGAPSKLLTGVTVIDTSEIQARRPGARIVDLGFLGGGRQHTETYARINGRDYVIGAEEASCPNGNGRIVDVSDPARPKQVANLELGANKPAGCLSTLAETSRSENLLLSTSHYVSVDDPSNATLAFFSWYTSGLRVFDIRDPAHPVEVAYFNPPVGPSGSQLHDSTTTYPRYMPETGQIWVGSGVNAFWVVELAPELRPEALRGRGPVAWSPAASPGARPDPELLRIEVRPNNAALYCTLVLPV